MCRFDPYPGSVKYDHYWYGGDPHGKHVGFVECKDSLYRATPVAAVDIASTADSPIMQAIGFSTWRHAKAMLDGKEIHLYVSPDEYEKIFHPSYKLNLGFVDMEPEPVKAYLCYECGYAKMRVRFTSATLYCPECNTVWTMEIWEHVDKQYQAKQDKGLFQINQGQIGNYTALDSQLTWVLMNKYMQADKIEQPKFDYRERAAVEFDCDEPEFRSKHNSGLV